MAQWIEATTLPRFKEGRPFKSTLDFGTINYFCLDMALAFTKEFRPKTSYNTTVVANIISDARFEKLRWFIIKEVPFSSENQLVYMYTHIYQRHLTGG